MEPAPSNAAVAGFLAGFILVTVVGHILLEYRQTGAATGQGNVATSSSNAKSTSQSPSPIPSTQVSASPNAKPTSRSPSPIPSAQASDSHQGTGTTRTNHKVDDRNKPTVDDSDQVKTAASIRDIHSVSGNNPIIVGSSGVNTSSQTFNINKICYEKEAATGQGDVATSSSNAKPTSRSPSPIPFLSDSPEGAEARETNQRVDGSKKPTVDASDKVKSAGIIAATEEGDVSTPSPNAESTSRSPSPIPSTQASGTGAIETIHSVDDSNEPTVDGSDQVKSAATRQGDVATSSPNAKPTSPSPTPIPPTQVSASIGNIGSVSGSSPIIFGSSGVNIPAQSEAATGQGDDTTTSTDAQLTSPSLIPSTQASASIGYISSVSGSNPFIVGSSGVNIRAPAATGQGDDTTTSPDAQLTSPSLIPSTQASASIGNIGSVSGSSPFVVGSSGVNIRAPAATGQGDDTTTSPDAQLTSPSLIPSTQASVSIGNISSVSGSSPFIVGSSGVNISTKK